MNYKDIKHRVSKNESRTKKASRNATVSIITKLLMIVFAFSVRTVFIKTLGAEYNGISSLYSDILSVLSLADLGMGSICSFYLYSALSNNDEHKVYLISIAFKRIYRYIMISVGIIGISIIPFLRFIVKGDINGNKLILYYVLFLTNNIISYVYTYRSQVMYADQKQYILNISNTLITSVLYVFQIVFLLITKNYLVYLILEIIFNLLNKLVWNIIVCKHYPYLNDGKFRENKYYIKNISKNVTMTFVGKLSDVIISQTDSILISVLVNTITVGYYSNYNQIIIYIINFFGVFIAGIISSFGNMQTENNKEKSYRYFCILLSLWGVLATTCAVFYTCIINDFIIVWIGKKYLMSSIFIFVLVFNFFVRILEQPMIIYRETLGIFRKGQIARILAAIVNIVLSIILGLKFGVLGIIAATPISKIITYFWYDGVILMNYYKKSIARYYLKMMKIIFMMIVITCISFLICEKVKYEGWFAILLKLLICSLVLIVIELPFIWKSDMAEWLKSKFKIYVKK